MWFKWLNGILLQTHLGWRSRDFRKFVPKSRLDGAQEFWPLKAPSGLLVGHGQRKTVFRWNTCLFSAGAFKIMCTASLVFRSLVENRFFSSISKWVIRKSFLMRLLGQCRGCSRVNLRKADLYSGQIWIWSLMLESRERVLCSFIRVPRLRLVSPMYERPQSQSKL